MAALETRLAVASNQGVVDFYDTTSGKRLARVDGLLAEPHEMTFDQRRRRIYVSHTYRSGFYNGEGGKGHNISVIDVDRRSLVSVFDISPLIAPHDIEYNEADDKIYAGIERSPGGENGVAIIEAETGAVVAHIPTRAPNTHWISLDPDGRTLYASHKEGDCLSVVDLIARKVVNEIAMPGGAEEIHVSPHGGWLFAVTPTLPMQRGHRDPERGSANVPRLVKIDLARGEVIGEVELGVGISALRVSGDGTVLIGQLPLGGDDTGGVGRLHIVDGVSMTLLDSIELGRGPFTTRVSQNAETAFVANTIAGTVSVVDMRDHTVKMTLDNTPSDTWGGSHGLVLFDERDAQ